MAPEESAPEGDSAEIGEFRQTPKISLLFLIFDNLKGAVPALVALIVFSDSGRFGFLFLLTLALGAGLVGAMLRWVSFGYRFDSEELVLRSGILSRNERHVPYHRFQNIDLEQNPLHRLLGVAKVRLETASGGKPEAVISVLRLPEVDEMRERVFAPRKKKPVRDGVPGAEEAAAAAHPDERADDGSEPEASEEDAENQLLRNSAGDLALLGLISNKGLLVVAAAFGLAEQFGAYDDPRKWERWFGGVGEWIGRIELTRLDPGVTALYVVLLVLVFLALTRVLSVAWMLVTLWGFRLIRRGEDLRTGYGLFTRITATIPRHRVQLLSWHESLIHQWTGTTSVRVETAGGGAAGGDESSSQQMPGNASRLWLAPILRRDELRRFFGEVTPDLAVGDPEELPWQPISRRAARRLFRRTASLVVAILILTSVGLRFTPFDPAWSAVLLVLVPWLWFWAHRWTARTGYALTDRCIVFRSGAFGRRTSVVPLNRIQVVQFQQNPFDRRAVMAKVRADTAGANLSSHRIVIPYLDLDDARRVAQTLERHASETSFRW